MLCTYDASGLSFSCALVPDSRRCTVSDLKRRGLPLCRGYEAVLFDAQPLQVWGDEVVANRAIFWALGLTEGGQWDVLDVRPSSGAGLSGWSGVFGDLKSRGVERVRVFTFPEREDVGRVAGAAFPQAISLPSLGWLQRTSLMQVPPRDRPAVADAVERICSARSLAVAKDILDAFAKGSLSARCAASVDLWRAALEQLAPYYALPEQSQRHIRSGEGILQGLHEAVVRAVTRHGPFADAGAALSVVLEALQRAGRRVAGEVAPSRPRAAGCAVRPARAGVAALVS